MPSEKTELSLFAATQGWLEVRGADGTIFVSRIFAQGETYYPRVGANWSVSARDGAAWEWRMGADIIAPLGEAGIAVHSESIDGAANQAAEVLLERETAASEAPVRR